MNAVRSLGLSSRWEAAGAWLTTEGAPVDVVVDRVTTSYKQAFLTRMFSS